MSKDKVRQYLVDLRTEINKLEENDESTKERLNNLTSEIERLLENPDDTKHNLALVQNLQMHTKQFEIEHPSVTSVLNQIMVTLSNMGI